MPGKSYKNGKRESIGIHFFGAETEGKYCKKLG